MTEPIHVTPEVLRDAADGHQAAAEYLRTVPASNEDIQATLDSLGPVYAELREEARIKLDERRQNYEAQAADHDATAAGLRQAHALWDNHERSSTTAFRALTGDA
ncbi:ESX-1 secretion-associated protein [Mycolicibacterium novocastrense]|uniref:ESX-1 secretion-associated protein n=1 Tax=Mycolicibacterium novocastrense TaxID=59813 RepID=A0AAW5SKA0_MYCNV|nr:MULTISPECIES: type VII secretion target [Mycolicibacterium]MCV7023649.1 ESX-1 secretion-associated protein [Mycolicibacterium novocastrense]MDX1886884.1 type VII secretion target [Mycolicibacterium sp. 120270]GAT07707.1 uncharacterized protein RMCN_0840 [Mycolicibacterium novocastrense]